MPDITEFGCREVDTVSTAAAVPRATPPAGRRIEDFGASICCPRCRSALLRGAAEWLCSNGRCPYAERGFPVAAGQPVLIDFERSIFERSAYTDGRGSVLKRDDSGRGLRTRLRGGILGGNPVADRMCRAFLELAKARDANPAILIVGGGAVGDGTERMYRDASIRLVVTDVYASPNTSLLADGHQLPFPDESFEAIWIQAVLEHVLEPQRVADEIHRVLKPGGLVYADTPFMQQVHEGAYDFTRFTRSGHRWLFRRFDEIKSGAVGGAGMSLLWSIRYFWRAFGAGNPVATLATVPFFWLQYLERFMRRDLNTDAANGVFFFGSKSAGELHPKEIVTYYARDRQTKAGRN